MGCGSGSGGICGNGGGLCSPQGNSLRHAGLGHGAGAGHASTICASTQAPAPACSPQGPFACPQSGCGLKRRHFHRLGNGCGACNGNGCGLCQGGGMASGTLCGACNGNGCGLCGGQGLLHGLGHGKGHGGTCPACGGHGCKLCGGTGCCGLLLGSVARLLHIGDIDYFLGPGGPVPLTPGYVPYVVTTRSPRDYFAFPPFSDVDP
jgi:hypothetical protein